MDEDTPRPEGSFTWERPPDCTNHKPGEIVAVQVGGRKLAFCLQCNVLGKVVDAKRFLPC